MTSSMIWTISLTFSCSLLLTAADAADCQYFAALGESYVLPLNVDLKPEHRIKWTWDKTRTVLYDSKRTAQNTHSVKDKKSLIIPKVTREDAGFYTWEILDKEGKRVDTNQMKLCVLDTVSKPKVTFKCDEKQKKVQFSCSGLQPDGVTYHWFEGEKIITTEKSSILLRSIEKLKSSSVRCNVSNPVSSQTSDPVQQNCLKPHEADDGLLFGLDFWLMIGILAGGGGLVLVLIVVTIVCCCNNQKKRRMQLKDEQELRLQWSTGNNQHQPNYQNTNQRSHAHSHGPSPRPAAGRSQGPTSAGNTGPRPPRARQNRPRPPDPITGQPLPGPRRLPEPGQTQVSVNNEENPPPLPQPRKQAAKRTQR